MLNIKAIQLAFALAVIATLNAPIYALEFVEDIARTVVGPTPYVVEPTTYIVGGEPMEEGEEVEPVEVEE